MGVSIPQAVSTIAIVSTGDDNLLVYFVSIPQAVSTIAMQRKTCREFKNFGPVSIPQAVSTIAISISFIKFVVPPTSFQYRKR